jgi:hypothetical protein
MASLVVSGDTSGAITLSAPSVAGTNTLSLPAQTATLATLTTPSFATTIGVGGATAAASGAGITFPATQSASSNANTLDDYEEGTWTPSFGSTSGSATYLSQVGTYTKVGRLVTAVFFVRINVSSSLVSDGYLNGLPFTAANTAYAGAGLAAHEGGTFNGYCNMLMLIASGGTTAQLRATTSATQAPITIIGGVTLANDTFLSGTISYYAA